jgi:hypothetical protein
MTNTELTNYLSNKQCCLETLTMEAIDALQIGNSSARCKQKEVIFGNILFEVLSCTTINRDQFDVSVSPLTTVPDTYTVTVYINGIQISDLLTVFSPDFIEYTVNNINNYTSSLDVYVNLESGVLSLNSNILDDNDYELYAITNYPTANTRIDLIVANITTNGSTCLDEEDVCVIAPYLNKICESC